jgi:hypothetical protein
MSAGASGAFALLLATGARPALAASAAPVVKALSTIQGGLPGAPDGPSEGGSEVLIDGANLSECSLIGPGGEGLSTLAPRGCQDVLVHFGSEPGLVLEAMGEGIVVFSPAHAPGTVDVTVTTPAGTSAVNTADRFTYTGEAQPLDGGPVPVVSEVAPREGPAAGFGEVQVKGQHLLGEGASTCVSCAGVVVRFGSVAVPVLEGSQGELGVVFPPQQAAGPVDVTVTTLAGTSAPVEGARFDYLAPPLTPAAPATSPAPSATPGPPSATISSPASGGHYAAGQVVRTSFACSEAIGGPGLSSRTDSGGASAPHGRLETAKLGRHTYVVSAHSKDGLTGYAVVFYTVQASRVRIASARARVRGGRARIVLACAHVAASASCRGTLTLLGRTKQRARARKRAATGTRTLVLARARYALPAGARRTVSLRLTKAALKLLGHARGRRLSVRASATVSGGDGASRAIVLERGSVGPARAPLTNHLATSRPLQSVSPCVARRQGGRAAGRGEHAARGRWGSPAQFRRLAPRSLDHNGGFDRITSRISTRPCSTGPP